MRPVVLCILILTLFAVPVSGQVIVLRDGNVIDVRSGVVSKASILIRDGMIDSVGPGVSHPDGATTIDVSGLWVVPGLVEMHSHTVDKPTLQMAFSLGITSALTVYTGPEPTPDIEGWSNLPTAPSPRIHLIGGRFTAEFPGDLIPGVPRFSAPADPAEAAQALQDLTAHGTKRIKIWMDDNSLWSGDQQPMPVFSPDVFGSLVRGARARGLKIYVHAWSADLYRMALDLKPDWIIHPVMDRDLTRSDIQAIRTRGLGWTSTMSLVLAFGHPDKFAHKVLDDPRLRSRLCVERRKAWRQLQSRAGIENKQYQAQQALLAKVDAGEIDLEVFRNRTRELYEAELATLSKTP